MSSGRNLIITIIIIIYLLLSNTKRYWIIITTAIITILFSILQWLPHKLFKVQPLQHNKFMVHITLLHHCTLWNWSLLCSFRTTCFDYIYNQNQVHRPIYISISKYVSHCSINGNIIVTLLTHSVKSIQYLKKIVSSVLQHYNIHVKIFCRLCFGGLLLSCVTCGCMW